MWRRRFNTFTSYSPYNQRRRQRPQYSSLSPEQRLRSQVYDVSLLSQPEHVDSVNALLFLGVLAVFSIYKLFKYYSDLFYQQRECEVSVGKETNIFEKAFHESCDRLFGTNKKSVETDKFIHWKQQEEEMSKILNELKSDISINDSTLEHYQNFIYRWKMRRLVEKYKNQHRS
jgi:hypothetical protein